MESNRMCNQRLGAPLAVVTDVPAQASGMRTVAPSLCTVQRQQSARLQSSAASINAQSINAQSINSMRPAADERDYAVAGAPKHAPRAFAPSGTRTSLLECTWSPPV